MSEALTVVEGQPIARMESAPEVVLAEAQKAAAALKKVIQGKPKPVVINGETYLEFEDWQTVGRFYGYTAGAEGAPEFVELGGARGFKATAIAIDSRGTVRSRATAYCMDDEDRWTKAPTYQLASMAQTRANAKALRNVLSWVTVLAGYKATPAEEMDGVRSAPRPQPGAAGKGEKAACPNCGKKVLPSKYPKPTASHYCMDCKLGFIPKPNPPAGSQADEPWDESEG